MEESPSLPHMKRPTIASDLQKEITALLQEAVAHGVIPSTTIISLQEAFETAEEPSPDGETSLYEDDGGGRGIYTHSPRTGRRGSDSRDTSGSGAGSHFNDRFAAWLAKKNEKAARARAETAAVREHDPECTFSPETAASKRTFKGNQVPLRLLERMQDWQRQREQRLESARYTRMTEELMQCSFEPSITAAARRSPGKLPSDVKKALHSPPRSKLGEAAAAVDSGAAPASATVSVRQEADRHAFIARMEAARTQAAKKREAFDRLGHVAHGGYTGRATVPEPPRLHTMERARGTPSAARQAASPLGPAAGAAAGTAAGGGSGARAGGAGAGAGSPHYSRRGGASSRSPTSSASRRPQQYSSSSSSGSRFFSANTASDGDGGGASGTGRREGRLEGSVSAAEFRSPAAAVAAHVRAAERRGEERASATPSSASGSFFPAARGREARPAGGPASGSRSGGAVLSGAGATDDGSVATRSVDSGSSSRMGGSRGGEGAAAAAAAEAAARSIEAVDATVAALAAMLENAGSGSGSGVGPRRSAPATPGERSRPPSPYASLTSTQPSPAAAAATSSASTPGAAPATLPASLQAVKQWLPQGVVADDAALAAAARALHPDPAVAAGILQALAPQLLAAAAVPASAAAVPIASPSVPRTPAVTELPRAPPASAASLYASPLQASVRLNIATAGSPQAGLWAGVLPPRLPPPSAAPVYGAGVALSAAGPTLHVSPAHHSGSAAALPQALSGAATRESAAPAPSSPQLPEQQTILELEARLKAELATQRLLLSRMDRG